MKIEVMQVSPFEQNGRILICEQTKEAILIDPGEDPECFVKRIKELQLHVKYMLATHGHADHINAVGELQKIFQIPFYMHEEDAWLIPALPQQSERFGMPVRGIPTVTKYLEDNEPLQFGQMMGKAIHTPGHSPGSMSFLFGNDVFVGDLLFAGSVGRTDFWGGSFETLKQSIQKRIYTLPPATVIHPGHGPCTTVGEESLHNPFVHNR